MKSAAPKAIEAKPALISRQVSCCLTSFAVAEGGCRSRKGCKSCITAAGRRVNTARPRQKFSRVKAANRIAKGGKYSANRFQRAVISNSDVDKKRKKSGRSARSRSTVSKYRKHASNAVHDYEQT